MKNIVIIATGGTIAGSGEAGRTTEYRAGTVAVADILKSVPQLGKLANIEMISLMSIDSNEMDEQKWLQLREVINQQAARDDLVMMWMASWSRMVPIRLKKPPIF